MNRPINVVIIGGGVSGLACAKTLHAAGSSFVLYEAAETLGGRVKTDRHEGFLLDRGFQVLLTAYPEARQHLDYDKLNLQSFYAGALVRFKGHWHRVADPFRHPWDGLGTLMNPIGTFADKLRVGRLRTLGSRKSGQFVDMSTMAKLRHEGFSESMIQRFFRPFLGGVYLESNLETTAAKFDSVFRFFSEGDIAVPAQGMGAIPMQLAEGLPPNQLRTRCKVKRILDEGVQLADDSVVNARSVVLATEEGEASCLLNGAGLKKSSASGVSCLYFDAPSPPLREPILILNGDSGTPINNLAVMSAVSQTYAPEGRALISVSVVDDQVRMAPDIESRVRSQLSSWFGEIVSKWRLLRIYDISQALPFQPKSVHLSPRIRPGIYRCGDYCGLASLNAALASGHAAAEAILKDQS